MLNLWHSYPIMVPSYLLLQGTPNRFWLMVDIIHSPPPPALFISGIISRVFPIEWHEDPFPSFKSGQICSFFVRKDAHFVPKEFTDFFKTFSFNKIFILVFWDFRDFSTKPFDDRFNFALIFFKLGSAYVS